MQPTQISVNTQPAMNAAACDAGMALASATIVGSPSTTASFFARAASATTATTYGFCRVAGVDRATCNAGLYGSEQRAAHHCRLCDAPRPHNRLARGVGLRVAKVWRAVHVSFTQLNPGVNPGVTRAKQDALFPKSNHASYYRRRLSSGPPFSGLQSSQMAVSQAVGSWQATQCATLTHSRVILRPSIWR